MMKINHYYQRFVLLFIMFMSGTLMSWAWDHSDGFKDDGNEDCTFRYNDNDTHDYWIHGGIFDFGGVKTSINPTDIRGFRTVTKLDNAAGTYYWTWHFRVIPQTIVGNDADDTRKCSTRGTIFFILKNGNVQEYGTFKKLSGETAISFVPATSAEVGESEWEYYNSTGYIQCRFMPKGFFPAQIEKVRIKIDETIYEGARAWGPFEYEKVVGGKYTGLPQPEFDWDDGGSIMASTEGAYNGLDQANCLNQSYHNNYSYTSKGGYYFLGENWWFTYTDNSVIRKDEQTMDARDYLNIDNWAPYTSPVKFSTVAYITSYFNPEQKKHEVQWKEQMEDRLVAPFTSPTDVKAEFDQWNKKITVVWKNIKEKPYSEERRGAGMVNCRTDGKWYVVRYRKNVDIDHRVYTLIGTLRGDASSLEFVDDDKDLAFSSSYVYRVIFLPTVLEEKYKDKPGEMPYSSLYSEVTVDVKLDIPIVLSQDRTDESGIKVVWQYQIGKTGCTFRLERRPSGSENWTEVKTMYADSKLDEAYYVDSDNKAITSACDFFDYRIVVTIEDEECYSDVLEKCSLPKGSYITDVVATTGTEENNVIVRWNVKQRGGDDTWFRVFRRPIGTEAWTLLVDDIHGTQSEYTYTDNRAMAGSYYEYSVRAYGARCEDQVVQSDDKITPGFAQARGTITGHVAFGSGTSVQDVRVHLVKSSADNEADTPQYLSRYISGEGKGLTWYADSAKYASVLNGKHPLSLQFWAMPSLTQGPSRQSLLYLHGALELGISRLSDLSDYIVQDEQNRVHTAPCNRREAPAGVSNDRYCLYAIDLSASQGLSFTVTEFRNLVFEKDEFTHVAARYTGSKWIFSVGNDTLATDSVNVTRTDWTSIRQSGIITLGLGGSRHFSGYNFSGYVDDVRLWSRALTQREVNSNYKRILGGTEDGMVLYWPLDEGINIVRYAFDISRQEGIYQLNHPVVGVNALPSTVVPNNLRLYGLTDGDGDYIIRGIPFQEGGTNYKLMPELGIHEFSPKSRSMFVSPTSLTANNIDFEDVSSFPMEGHVYFAGTNIPAEGIQFYIDGNLVTANGEVKKTDAKGYYLISVPIGDHYVEAKAGSHTMVGGGRFPAEGTYPFYSKVTCDFADSTLVNFVGRVSGGPVNDTIPVGFGASKNNIGIATLKLRLNNESFSFNCADDHISDATSMRTFESDTTSINSRTWTGVGTESRVIYIRTDSLTGEFSAKLPPLKYIASGITIASNPSIDFAALPEIDLTNPQKDLADSIKQVNEAGDTLVHFYKYHTKLVRTYFSTPKIEVRQVKCNLDTDFPRGAYGIRQWKDFTDEFGAVDIDDIWKEEGGKIKYRFDYPIYRTFDSIRMEVYGYEPYVNYDSGKPMPDTIPMKGQVLSIANEMAADQLVVADTCARQLGLDVGSIYNLKTNQVILGENGRNQFTWIAGLPNITAPYTRVLNITYERKGRTRAWDNPLQAIVLGALDEANNFLTQGPDQIHMVLRDPPGATSSTTWRTGSSQTKLRSEAHGYSGDWKISYDFSYGIKSKAFIGGMFFFLESVDLTETVDISPGIHYDVKRYNQTEQTWTITANKSISTSTGSPFVGADGDVFIGVSTNMLFGMTRKLGFFRNSVTAPFVLDLRRVNVFGTEVKTAFMYSQYELENVMIPKWKDIIKEEMTYVASEDVAKNYSNTTDHSIYVTWLERNNPDLGKDGTYIHLSPNNALGGYIDTISWCMDQIATWEKVLSDNEEDKVNAMKDPKYYIDNYSFDGGIGFNYSQRNDTTYQKTHNYDHNFSAIYNVGYTSDQSISTLAVKHNLSIETENGWTMSTVDSDYDENYNKWAEVEYAMSDGNKGTDFSVNVYKSPSGWSDIFSVVGGQSYNPYEGKQVTKYYEEGQHVLQNGTQQMEQPDIQISTDGERAAKTATLLDVPSGQTAQLTLHLTNNGITTQGFDFCFDLSICEGTNPHGLEILMDGVSINDRSIYVPAGETVKKVITLRQTDQSILEYKDVELWFASQYQPIMIYSAAKFNITFVPSSSPIDLVISNPILNTATGMQLNAKATNFNRSFTGLSKVGLQYRYENSPTWSTLYSYFVAKNDSTDAIDQPLPESSELAMPVEMSDDVAYPQGNYTFRAFTMTMYGDDHDQPIYVYSEPVTVVKDNVCPRALTTPTPTSGILGYGEDLSIEFNEDIVSGYVDAKNVIVTTRLNNQSINHDVAYHLESKAPRARTVNPIFLNGDFSLDFWLRWTTGGTILQQGDGDNKFTLGLDDEGHAQIQIGGTKYVSTAIVPKNKWLYMALSYNSADREFSLLAQYDIENVELFVKKQVKAENTLVIHYTDDNYLYLNTDNLTGDIHDLSLFNIYRDVHDAANTKYEAKDNYLYGLVNYWPMNEGHGTTISDTRHTHDFTANNLWSLSYDNKGLQLLDGQGIGFDLTQLSTNPGDSYAIELWFVVSSLADTATIFQTGSNAYNHLRLLLTPERKFLLEYGQKVQMVADLNSDGSEEHFGFWHHIALNVVRGQAASFYLDGKRTCVIDVGDLPAVEGTRFEFAKRFPCYLDEIRYWRASLSESRLLSNMYYSVDTADVYSRGLVAYFPFDKAEMTNNEWKRIFTLDNMARGATGKMDVAGEHTITPVASPLKYPPFESRLVAEPVASDRKVVIKLSKSTQPKDIEGTTLKITVDKIHDVNGNESQAISWTAYVLQNTLKWAKDSVNVNKLYGDDASFDVKIINLGGNVEYYSVQNLPQWLSLVDSDTHDAIEPMSEKTLRFKVNPYVAIGNYDCTIGIQGNLEILEPLRIVMKVSGEKPDWSVNPRAYEHQMTVIGQVRVDGILMENPEGIVAAFIDGKCRGVASPEVVRGAAYVTLGIYGNDINGKDKGKPITFCIWDATTGLTYIDALLTLDDGTQPEVVFTMDKVYGKYGYPAIWTKSNKVEQRIPTYENWNWLGLGVQPVSSEPYDVFADYTGWALVIKNQGTQTAYYNGAQWRGNLQVNANTMYKMKISAIPNVPELPSHLIVKGEQLVLSQTPVEISSGWNWIAYTPLVTMTLDEALAGLKPEIDDCVKSQYGIAYYGPTGWEGNLKALEPGNGYMYFSTAANKKLFVYPSKSNSSAPRRIRAAADTPSLFAPVDNHRYPDNMTMVIQLVDGTAVVDSAEVAAFVADECRGATRASGGLYYLIISGEGSEQPMSIYTYLNGTLTLLDNSQFYVSDANIGDPWTPYVIDLQNLRVGISDVLIDDTDDEWYTIQGFKLGRRPTQPGIYIHNGEKESIE